MPRSKLPLDQENLLLMMGIAALKSYSTDILADVQYIYNELLAKYGSWAEPETEQKMRAISRSAAQIRMKPVLENRVYIVCGFKFICLYMQNLDPCVVEHLQYVYDLCNSDLEYVDCAPAFLSSIFIFQKGQAPFWCELSSGQMATLMAVFHKENLVDFAGARDDFYGKPRREAKRRK